MNRCRGEGRGEGGQSESSAHGFNGPPGYDLFLKDVS